MLIFENSIPTERNKIKHKTPSTHCGPPIFEQANTFYPIIKFTAEISENEITFLDTVVFKGQRFIKKIILDTKTHYRPMETFQYTQFTSCHPLGVKRGFNKGEAILGNPGANSWVMRKSKRPIRFFF